jgi:hypothetical protein
MTANLWYNGVNAGALSDEARRLIPEMAKRKLGFEKTLRALGIARGLLYNYLHGVRTVPDNVVYRALQYLEEQEFNEIVQGIDRLRAVDITRGDSNVDYFLILQAIALATRDEYLKQALLKFTVESFRVDLRKMLGSSMAHIILKREPDIEEFLRERKKRRKIVSGEAMSYYRSLFKRYLEGKAFSEELVEYVVNHESK